MSATGDQGRVARMFDEVAGDYDQSGVAFFAPIATGLLDALAPRPGERVVDVGCGRGALTLPAARAVGASGEVVAVDVAPAMVELTRQAADAAGLTQVRTAVVAPDDLGLAEGTADVLAASLVLFFAADPGEVLKRWMRVLVPGGRVGVSTFGEQDATWSRVEALFRPHLPPGMLDARTSGAAGPFASDTGVEALFEGAGAVDISTVRTDLPVRFRDAEQWRTFSMSTGQRAFWQHVPAERRQGLFEEAADVLAQARTPDGDIVLTQQIRYTLARAPSA